MVQYSFWDDTCFAAPFCYHNEENRSHACVSGDLTNVFRARYVCVSRLCYAD